MKSLIIFCFLSVSMRLITGEGLLDDYKLKISGPSLRKFLFYHYYFTIFKSTRKIFHETKLELFLLVKTTIWYNREITGK